MFFEKKEPKFSVTSAQKISALSFKTIEYQKINTDIPSTVCSFSAYNIVEKEISLSR